MQHPLPFESVFTFGEPILLREIPPTISKLAICPQISASIVLYPSPSLPHPLQNKRVPPQEKEVAAVSGVNKIGKGLLRDCHASMVTCLSELLESMRALSIQLIKLSVETNHEIVLKALHHRTIDPSLQALDQSINRIDLPTAYRQLFEATQDIKKRMASFRKDFGIQDEKISWGVPSISKIWSSLSQ